MKPCNPDGSTVRRAALLAAASAALLAMAAPADAAKTAGGTRRIEAFDSTTWAALRAGLKAPVAVVFTTTDCAHCPAVIQQLGQNLGKTARKSTLIAVVMDQAPGDDDAGLLANAHFAPAQRLFAFDGQAPLIRHGIDPRWRGVTPFVVFLAPGQPPRTVTGPPSTSDIAAWQQSTGKAAAKPAR